jgi:hypothetical protein
MRFILPIAAITVFFVAFVATVAATGPDVRVTALDCESHPRRIRLENVGDAAQDLSGWQLQSDPVEGQPLDLAEVGTLEAGKKAYIFQGHLSPPTDPSAGFFRWGTDEIFNLRANDSSDYVRLVDPQGNNVSQRNCEGLPPGATPVPTSEYDPPPLVVATDSPTPVPPTPVAATPTPTTRPASAKTSPTARASSAPSPTITSQGVPAVGGPPAATDSPISWLALAVGALSLIAGALFVVRGLRR